MSVASRMRLAASAGRLTRWRAALGSVGTTPAPVLFLGDSVTEGAFATGIGARWVDRTLQELQAGRNQIGVAGGAGWVNTFFNGSAAANSFWNRGAGGSAANSGGFLGARTWNFAAAQTCAFTFTGTSFDAYLFNNAAASCTYTVDGGAPVTVTVPGTGGLDAYKHSSATFSAGSHTVVFTPGGSGTLYLRGVHINNGDEGKGVHGWESGHFGWKVSDWVTNVGAVQQAAAAIQPALLIVFLGLNDESGQTVPATFQSSLANLVSTVRAYCTVAPSVLYLAPYQRTDASLTTYTISDYVAAVRGAQQATPDSALVDLSTVITLINASSYLVDGVHPNDAGHQLIADAAATFLGVPLAADTSAPSVPTGLAATPGLQQVALTWSASTDNRAVTGYKLYRDGVLIQTQAGPSYTDTGLTGGQSYSYTVAAYDAAGNTSAQSSAVPAVPTSPVSTVAADTFTRSDSSGLGTSSHGETWTAVGGRFDVSSNQAKIGSYGGPTLGGVATVDSGKADATVSVDLPVVSSDPGLIVRYVDTTNFIKVGKTGAFKVTGGVVTQLGSTYTAFVSGDGMSVVLSGTSVVVKKNGTTIVTATESTLIAATKHGLMLNATGSVADRWDNFQVVG